jgi:hypothetical protein
MSIFHLGQKHIKKNCAILVTQDGRLMNSGDTQKMVHLLAQLDFREP